jgi:hypothetical protein
MVVLGKTMDDYRADGGNDGRKTKKWGMVMLVLVEVWTTIWELQ